MLRSAALGLTATSLSDAFVPLLVITEWNDSDYLQPNAEGGEYTADRQDLLKLVGHGLHSALSLLSRETGIAIDEHDSLCAGFERHLEYMRENDSEARNWDK